MGQYYIIVNLDKRESMSPHSLCSSAKLLEFGMSYPMLGLAILLANSNGRGGGDLNVSLRYGEQPTPLQIEQQHMIDIVAGRWAGDRIVVAGDYAEPGDKGESTDDSDFVSNYRDDSLTDISSIVLDAIRVDSFFRSELRSESRGATKQANTVTAKTLDKEGA